jgi:dolichol-phosphate mannosyltransferase
VSNYVVIIPTYKEIENLTVLLPELITLDLDILIVDDASNDGTIEFVQGVDRKNQITVLSRSSKQGLGSAYITGFKNALGSNYSHVIQMDADGSHRVKDLISMLAEIKQDQSIDLLIGSRWVPGGKIENWPKNREYLSRFANFYSQKALGSSVRDMTAGFRIYKTSLLREIPLDKISSQGYSFQIEMTRAAISAGARIKEHPITFIERTVGTSKMSSSIVLEAMVKVTRWAIARIVK